MDLLGKPKYITLDIRLIHYEEIRAAFTLFFTVLLFRKGTEKVERRQFCSFPGRGGAAPRRRDH
jgi:hypothetical protein